MKKVMTIAAMMLLSVMGLSACTAKTNKANQEAAESTNETTKKETTDMKGKKVLVAYFSWSGNTKEAAHYIAQKTGADEFEIIREKAYPTEYNACTEDARLRRRQASVLPSKAR